MPATRYDSVWDAIEDTPEAAREMRARSESMARVAAQVEAWGVSREEAARRLGIPMDSLRDLLDGRIQHFTSEELMTLEASW